jgi:hypothetical protein
VLTVRSSADCSLNYGRVFGGGDNTDMLFENDAEAAIGSSREQAVAAGNLTMEDKRKSSRGH